MADFIKVPVDLNRNIFDYVGTSAAPATDLANAAVGSTYRYLSGGSGNMFWQKTTGGWESVAASASGITLAFADGRYAQLATTNTMSSGVPFIFSNATSAWLVWSNVAAAPSFSTRSVGTKLVLWDSIGGGLVDYALGVESSTMWFSVPGSGNQFKWYAGVTSLATLSSVGNFTAIGNIVSAGFFRGDSNKGILIGNSFFGQQGSGYGEVGYNNNDGAGGANYAVSDWASRLRFISGNISFQTAPSGTAGGAISFTERLVVGPSSMISQIPYIAALVSTTYGQGNQAYLNVQAGTGGGNALRWGHSNPDFINTLGTYHSAGFPYISFHSYQTTGDAFLRLGSSTLPMQMRHDSVGGNFSILWGAAGTAGTSISWNEQFKFTDGGVFHCLASGGGIRSPYFLVTTGTGAGSYMDGSLNTHGSVAITGINSGYAGIRFVSIGYTLMSSGVGGVALGMYSGSAWMFYISDGADIAGRTTFWHNRQYFHVACTSSQSSGGIQFTNNSLTVKGYAYWDASGVGFLDSAGGWRLTCSTSGVSLFGASSCTSTLSATDFILT